MGRGRFSGDGFDDEFPDDETSVDLAAVRRDDTLIDAIAGNGLVETKDTEEYELATLLADWRAEILADPMPAGPDLDEVVAAVHRELGTRETLTAAPEVPPLRPRSRGQLRLLRPLAGAAALVAVAVGAATAVSYGAEPGDPLWGVKQVVFSEQAQSTEARIDTTSTLERAEQLIAEGNAEEARELLTSAESRSGDVRDAQERDALGDWLHRLADELGKMMPQLPPPPVPAVPAVPAPGVVVPPPATAPGTEGQLPAPSTGAESGTTVPPTTTTVPPTILQAPPPVSNTTTPSPTAPPPPSSTPAPSVPSEPPPPTSASPTSVPTTTASSPRPTQNGPGTDLAPASVTFSEGG